MNARLPPWFKQKIPEPQFLNRMERLLRDLRLHTVCESAICPNLGHCFSKGTATFMILGETCTRRCTFCAVKKGQPDQVDGKEPQHAVEAAKILGLDYVVLTSVTRDDLSDGGALHFAHCIRQLHEAAGVLVEVLIPDLQGSIAALTTIVRTSPEVLNHNIETVPRLYPLVRPGADYSRSKMILWLTKLIEPGVVTKSGLMLGLGESREEVVEVMGELKDAGCDLLTLGQYLQPSPLHLSVARFLHPEEFLEYERIGYEMGFAGVAAGPLVRSSYQAAELFQRARANHNVFTAGALCTT